MYKEISIIIIVIALILFLDVITNNYTTYAADTLSENLNTLREHIMVKNEKEIDNKINN